MESFTNDDLIEGRFHKVKVGNKSYKYIEFFKNKKLVGSRIVNCQFSKPSIVFLGYLVNENGIVPLPRKVETITAFPPPQKAKSLLGFLGAINYYRRCLPNINGKKP